MNWKRERYAIIQSYASESREIHPPCEKYRARYRCRRARAATGRSHENGEENLVLR
jgi:hypothetical protein